VAVRLWQVAGRFRTSANTHIPPRFSVGLLYRLLYAGLGDRLSVVAVRPSALPDSTAAVVAPGYLLIACVWPQSDRNRRILRE